MRKQITVVAFPDDSERDSSVTPVRHYYKYELAELYQVSQDTLVSYINRFLPQFELLGYSKYDKRLTKPMVRLLFQLIGEP